jgi:uncharacterized protein DUF6958
MPGKTAEKVECLNPNTGGKMRIDAGIYENFSKAIYHTLKQNKNPITYTEIVKGVKECFKENKTKFNGSIEWYAVTVKHDMVANHIIETWMEKGTRWHKLAPSSKSKK